MTIDELREEIANEIRNYRTVASGFPTDWQSIDEALMPELLDKILSLVVKEEQCQGYKEEVCWFDKVLGKYVVTGWDSNEICPTCHGTGKVPVTIKDILGLAVY